MTKQPWFRRRRHRNRWLQPRSNSRRPIAQTPFSLLRMLCELVETTTADGLTLHGAFYRNDRSPDIGLPLDAVLLVHGVGGNFYSSVLLERLAASFLQCGLTVVCANTRGHDFVSLTRTSVGPQRQGQLMKRSATPTATSPPGAIFSLQRGAERLAVAGTVWERSRQCTPRPFIRVLRPAAWWPSRRPDSPTRLSWRDHGGGCSRRPSPAPKRTSPKGNRSR